MKLNIELKETMIINNDNDILEIIQYIIEHGQFHALSPCCIESGFQLALIEEILKVHKESQIRRISFSCHSTEYKESNDPNFFDKIQYETINKGLIDTSVLKRKGIKLRKKKFELIEDSLDGQAILKKMYQLQEIFKIHEIHYCVESDVELCYEQFNELLQECKSDEEYERVCREEKEHIISILISYIENACDHDEEIANLLEHPYWSEEIYKEEIEKVYTYEKKGSALYRRPFNPFNTLKDKRVLCWEKLDIKE